MTFIGETLGEPVERRGVGTMAVLGVSAWPGARVFRVHDVAAARRALDPPAAQGVEDSRWRAR